MLSLQKISLQGFKSFRKKTTIRFNGGVTAIVGPNGCGKSNLADAVSWVLGEQRLRSLRTEKMNDVIFKGNQERNPLNWASVTLHLTDETTATGHTICRQIDRLGKIRYRMNGENCGLKDIRDTLAGTGLGHHAYFLVGQGEIGDILSSDPKNRRKLIEEAAQIARFREKKKQALQKLEQTEANILRLEDLRGEVKKQWTTLRQQAGRARKFQAYRHEIRSLKEKVFTTKLAHETRNHEDLRRQEEAVREELSLIQEAHASEEAALRSAQQALERTTEKIHAIQERLHEARLEQSQSQERDAYLRKREEELVARLSGLDQKYATQDQAIKKTYAQLLSKEKAFADLVLSATAAHEKLKSAEEKHEADEERLSHQIERLHDLKVSLFQAQTDLSEKKNEKLEHEKTLRRTHSAGSRREKEKQRQTTEQEKLVGSLDDLASEIRDRTAEEKRCRRDLAKTERQHDRLTRKKQMLEKELAVSTSGLVESIADEPSSELEPFLEDASRKWHPRGRIVDFVKPAKGYEAVVHGGLSPLLQSIVLERRKEALEAMSDLEKSAAGMVRFLVAEPRKGKAKGTQQEELLSRPGVHGFLDEHLQVKGPYRQAILRLLSNALLVEDVETAFELWNIQPGLYVTLQGHCLSPLGLLKGSSFHTAGSRSTGKRSGSTQQNPDVQRVHEEMEQLISIITQNESAIARLRSQLVALESKGQKAQYREEALLLASDERRRSIDIVAEELDQIRRDEDELEERLAQVEPELVSLKQRKEEITAAIAETEQECRSLRQKGDAARKRTRRLQEEANNLSTQRVALQKELEHLSMSLQEGSERARARELEENETQQSLDMTRDQLLEAHLNKEETRRRGRCRERGITRLRALLEKRDQETAEKSESLNRRARRSASLEARRHELELRRERHESRIAGIQERARREIHAIPKLDQIRMHEVPSQDEIGAWESSIQKLEAKTHRLGAVNLLAIEEEAQLQERHDFLEDQITDLRESIRSLRSTVRKIDRVSKERFLRAFEVINANFGSIYSELFEGGEAKLILKDPGKALESGIDIMAQPPGKRLQSLQLLSSGEKAMTAIALLFAILRYNPSPFCFFDEIDATLDEANIHRFVKLIEQSKDQLQIVLITHNKQTMKVADTFYGVTMLEPNVSQILTVDLRSIHHDLVEQRAM